MKMDKKQKNLLVVAKGYVMQRLFRRCVERAGHKAVVVDSGNEALVKITNDEIDLILWDLDTTQLKDIEIINQIKKRFEIRVIVVADIYEKAAFNKSVDIPGSDYLAKPLNVAELVSKVTEKSPKKDR